MNILLSIAMLAACYLVSMVAGGEIIDAMLLYMLLLINDQR